MTVQENFFHRASDDPARNRVCRQVALLWPSAGLLYHTIFQLAPTNESRQLAICDCEPVSRWVVDSLLEVYETRKADAVVKGCDRV
jgi:hypothetical protein